MTGQFITTIILGVACILFAAAWLTERKSRKAEYKNRVFFSRMYSKSLIRLSDLNKNSSTSTEG